MNERTAVYRELAHRVIRMRHSDEQRIFLLYELALYEKLSALTDAVWGDMLTFPDAQHRLDEYITSLKPRDGSIRI